MPDDDSGQNYSGKYIGKWYNRKKCLTVFKIEYYIYSKGWNHKVLFENIPVPKPDLGSVCDIYHRCMSLQCVFRPGVS